MKGISIKQPWAGWIARGDKTIETRTWQTDYRGPLLICASAKRDERAWQADDPPICRLYGVALAIAELVDCGLMTRLDEPRAMCVIYPRANALVLERIWKLPRPLIAKGALYLWDVDNEVVPEWDDSLINVWEMMRPKGNK